MSDLPTELLSMAAEDARVRRELAANGSLFDGYDPTMREVHDRNAERLARILAEQGWPGTGQVGAEAAEAAWLVVQHAIGWPALQRAALTALREAATRGDVPAWRPAMLDDRIRIFEGMPHLYGTQLDWDSNGLLVPLPIADPSGVSERRRSVGLPTLEQSVAEARRAAEEEGERPPADWDARQEQRERWLREVGWRPRS